MNAGFQFSRFNRAGRFNAIVVVVMEMTLMDEMVVIVAMPIAVPTITPGRTYGGHHSMPDQNLGLQDVLAFRVGLGSAAGLLDRKSVV